MLNTLVFIFIMLSIIYIKNAVLELYKQIKGVKMEKDSCIEMKSVGKLIQLIKLEILLKFRSDFLNLLNLRSNVQTNIYCAGNIAFHI